MNNEIIVEINSLYHTNEIVPSTATENRYYTIEYINGVGGDIQNFRTGEEAVEFARSRTEEVYVRLFNSAGGRIRI